MSRPALYRPLLLVAWAIGVTPLLAGPDSGPDSSPVQFDAPSVLSAGPLDDSPVARTLPNSRHFEITVPVSTLVRGSERLPDFQLWYFLQFPWSDARIVDFTPRTELTSRYVGPLQIDRQHESRQQLGLSLNPKLDGWGTGQAKGELSGVQKEQRRSTESPPMVLLQTSGTLDRGTGVYFKFRPSRQTTLEGSRDLHVVIEVPADWRLTTMRLHCRAESLDGDQRVLGQAVFPIAVYAIGDEQAGTAARRFVQAEQHLRSEWRIYQANEAKAKPPRLGFDILSLVNARETQTLSYESVVNVLAFSRDSRQLKRLLGSLPEFLRAAANDVADARKAMFHLRATAAESN